MRERGRGEGEAGKIFLSLPIDGITFVPSFLFTRYKCDHIYTWWWLRPV
jgi:hypothetical protein